MADPKYQDLPYIAVGEPDLYETGDLPEADQGLVDDAEQDQIVESIAVDPKKAFRRFNKATVDGSGTDFSGDQRGYSVHYELLPAGEEESILQKLQRIKSELKQINDSVKTNFNDPDVNPASILSEVESLQKDVDGISLSSIASQDANTAGYNKLLAELTSVASKSSPKKGTAGSSAQGATFELNYAPDAVVSAKGANLEARVAQLESLIGQPGDDKILAESVGGQTVMDAVATLSSKLHLLDEDKVDKLSARLQVLLQSLNKVGYTAIPKLIIYDIPLHISHNLLNEFLKVRLLLFRIMRMFC